MFPSCPRPFSRWLPLVRASALACVALACLVGAVGRAQHVRADAAPVGQTQLVVCVDGPPACDFGDLQSAIDAAAPGADILVHSGVYSGNVTLRSGLSIRGAAADPPVLTAGRAPIVAATGVTSATLAHLTLDGRREISTGMALTDVNLSLQHVSIVDVHGRDAGAANVHGDNAVAIHLAGQGRVTADALKVVGVHGGNGFFGYDPERYVSEGGDASVIAASGFYSLTLRDLLVMQVYGGDAGDGSWTPYGCSTSGGDALGINVSRGDVLLSGAYISDFRAGAPCNMDVGYYCREYAGVHSAIRVSGGTLIARDVSVYDFFSTVAQHPRRNTGIDIEGLERVILERIAVESLKGFVQRYDDDDGADVASAGLDPENMDAPFCNPTALEVVGVSIGDVDDLFINDLTVRALHGAGYGSLTRGVDISSVKRVSFLFGLIDNVVGGHQTQQTDGLRVSNVDDLHLSGVDVRNIRGGDGPDLPDPYYRYEGGSAAGITLYAVNQGTVAGNSIWNVVGGTGTIEYFCFDEEICPPYRGSGGDAIGLYAVSADVNMWLNTIYKTTPGLPPLPDGIEPRSVGVVAVALDASLAGSIIGEHQTGILALTGELHTYDNAYWRNDVHVNGAPEGYRIWYEDPQFVDADGGDLHLTSTSPLIQAVDNRSSEWPVLDIDGTVRDYRGFSQDDIGADIFGRGPLVAEVSVTPEGVQAGSFITVTSTLVDAGRDARRVITAITMWGHHAVLVPDSLHANYGEVEFVDNLAGQSVVWRGQPTTSQGDVTSSLRAEVRFVLYVLPRDESLLGRVTTRVFDSETQHNQKDEARFLINPRFVWLPLIAK